MADTYFCSPEKTELSIDIAKRELGLLNKLDYEKGYSLYIGIPFCPSTCLYCSFTSYPLSAWEKRVDEYLDALEKEIDYTAEQYRERHLNTIYIGGGTPTTLAPYQLDRLIRKIKSSFDLSHLLEFTVEAGRPDSITKRKIRGFAFPWDFEDFDQSTDHEAGNVRDYRTASYGRADYSELFNCKRVRI